MNESKAMYTALLLIDVCSAYLLLKKIQVRISVLRDKG